MNRQMKRAQRREGSAASRSQPAAATRRAATQERKKRTTVREFLHQVRQEMKKVAWPSRQELIAYTVVVLVAVTVLTAYVFGLDVAFSKLVVNVFGRG